MSALVTTRSAAIDERAGVHAASILLIDGDVPPMMTVQFLSKEFACSARMLHRGVKG